MNVWRTLIVDDEDHARQKVVNLLADHEDFTVIGEAGNGRRALKLAEELEPDVIFLDISMPGVDGISVAAHLVSTTIRIVFITGFDDYAVKAFELNALDYLLKPFDKQRFATTLNRLRASITPGETALRNALSQYREQSSYPDKLLVRADEGLEVLPVKEILWVETSGNYLKICKEDAALFIRMTLISLLEQLDPRQFIRIHRSHAVNLNAVARLQPLGKNDYQIEMKDGAELRLSRAFKDDFFDRFES